eukprot:10198938-Prorocentrum_lima.AAC.1
MLSSHPNPSSVTGRGGPSGWAGRRSAGSCWDGLSLGLLGRTAAGSLGDPGGTPACEGPSRGGLSCLAGVASAPMYMPLVACS